jgi:hypothetical protein
LIINNRKENVNMERKIGWGTSSIGILILSILFSINLSRTFCLGDVVLNGLGLKTYSSGNGQGMHYTIFYSAVMLIAGYIVGRIFSKDIGAKAGRRICAILGAGFVFILIALVPSAISFNS